MRFSCHLVALMGKHVQTDVPDIFTGSKKKKKTAAEMYLSRHLQRKKDYQNFTTV